MTLYRVFPWARRRFVRPLDVPRSRQGANRHDNPDLYTALYLAREPDGAIAEAIQGFRGRTLTDRDLERADRRRLALATLDDREVPRWSTWTTRPCWWSTAGGRRRWRPATEPRPSRSRGPCSMTARSAARGGRRSMRRGPT